MATFWQSRFKHVHLSREEFDNVAFVYISDDMKWGKKNLKKVENIFFLGCGDSDDPGKITCNP